MEDQRISLARLLQMVSVEILGIPGEIEKKFDCSSGEKQLIAEHLVSITEDLYSKYSVGAIGYSFKKVEDIEEYINDKRDIIVSDEVERLTK